MRGCAFLACLACLACAAITATAQVPVGRPGPAPGTNQTTIPPTLGPSISLPATAASQTLSSTFAESASRSGAATAGAPTVTGAADPAPSLEVLGKKVDALSKGVDELSKNLTVSTGDGDFKLVLGGAITADFLYNTTRPVASGTPFYLPPEAPFGFDTRTFDAHARGTTLFGLFTGPDVFDLKAGGFVLVCLYDNTIIADRYGLLPINAFGELKNDDWRFAAGYQMDIFNPLNPNVLAFSLLAPSGNTGMFRGQLRAERFIHLEDDTQITLTGGLSEPIPTTVNNQLRISEDNGIPNLEGRAAVGFGPMEGAGPAAHRQTEVGASGAYGQIRTVQTADRVVANIWGAGIDARLGINDRCGVLGEAYVGQGLGTYGASGLQNINPATFRTIRTAGFWVEGYYYWCPATVHTHVGYGVDDPANSDAGATIPVRNETYYANIMWDVTNGLRVAFQITYLKTAYSILKDNDGLIFHTQFQFKF